MEGAARTRNVALLMATVLAAMTLSSLLAPPAAATGTTWAKTYDGPTNETPKSVQPTSDGGYVVLGETYAFSGGDRDVWVLKLNGAGVIQWQYLYGGPGRDVGQKILETSDGGYVVGAYTVGSFAANYDTWILKLDATGGILWQKFYNFGILLDIQQTADGGYIAAGERGGDAGVMKLDAAGNVVWLKKVGTNADYECANSIQQTADGGYIAAGSKVYKGYAGAWLFRLNSAGSLQWANGYTFGTGGTLCGEEGGWTFPKVLIASDGGYLLVGNVFDDWWQDRDGLVIKVDTSGNIQWQKAYGLDNPWSEYFSSAATTSDGGYILAGNYGNPGHAWAVRIDASGAVQWQKTYGTASGPSKLYGTSLIHQTPDGGFVLAGQWSEGISTQGIFVMKLDGSGNVGGCTDPGIGTDSNAGVSNPARAAYKIHGTAKTVSATVSNTSVSPTAASGSESQQCSG